MADSKTITQLLPVNVPTACHETALYIFQALTTILFKDPSTIPNGTGDLMIKSDGSVDMVVPVKLTGRKVEDEVYLIAAGWDEGAHVVVYHDEFLYESWRTAINGTAIGHGPRRQQLSKDDIKTLLTVRQGVTEEWWETFVRLSFPTSVKPANNKRVVCCHRAWVPATAKRSNM